MKILILSDLHLGDRRNSAAFEKRRLEKLAELIHTSGAGLVLNLGDTVSRKEFLRPEIGCSRNGYRDYLAWRNSLAVPFAECAVNRELPFFRETLGQEPDAVHTPSPEMTIITMDPEKNCDHTFTDRQLDFLIAALRNSRAPRILIATHVPYPGSCSRPAGDGIFLEIPEPLRKAVEESERNIYWCGGHFHWEKEEPVRLGSLTAFHGGRFPFETTPEKSGWLRSMDTQTGEIRSVSDSFFW